MRALTTLRGIFIALVLVLMVCSTVDAKVKNKAKTPRAAPSGASGGGVDDGSGDYVTEKRGDTTVKYKSKTKYDFEGLGVEAMADKPTGAYISNIKDVKARSLIQIRKDFDAEVNETARQMP